MHNADTIVYEVYFRNFGGKLAFRYSSAFVDAVVSPQDRAEALLRLWSRGYVVLQAQDPDAPARGVRRETRATSLALAAGRALARGDAAAAAYYRARCAEAAAYYRAHGADARRVLP
jgi:hypothetical protein